MNLPNGGDKQVINDGNKVPTNHHKYNLSYLHACRERFGEANPFVFAYGVPNDKNFTFRIGHELRTTSLASPLLQNLRKNLDFYAVPAKAILPHTWDFLQTNPVIGDDIDPRLTNCLIYLSGEADNLTGLKDLFYHAINSAGVIDTNAPIGGIGSEDYDSDAWDGFVHLLIALETFFAKDSLMASFRMPLHKRVGILNSKYTAETLSQAWKFYHDFLKAYAAENSVETITLPFLDSAGTVLFTRTYKITDLSDRMRLYFDLVENPYVDWLENGALTSDLSNEYVRVISGNVSKFSMLDRDSGNTGNYGYIKVIDDWENATKPIDIRPVLAYQLVMAEYFTNDKIDYVYSADMLRKIYEGFYIDSTGSTYRLNGNSYPYDGFSADALSSLFYSASAIFSSQNPNWYAFSLLINLFTRKRTLRFVDYFTGARSHPLAVGDVNVSVDAQGVSAIDMTKGIQTARYLLAVNRVGPKAKEYLKGIFGANERTRTDVPVKVGHIDSVVYGVETQNTGAAQLEAAQTITTNLTTRTDDFAFQMDLEEDTMLIGIASYEIARFYLEGWSKFANKVDRFDHFNPYYQYTGDQPILQSELQAGLDDDLIFGYQSKDMEYKLNTDFAVGFEDDDEPEQLRGWIFAMDDIKDPIVISPEFIRAHQTELDRYFLSMTGTQASQRWHFICKYNNKIEASRNMVFDPQILK